MAITACLCAATDICRAEDAVRLVPHRAVYDLRPAAMAGGDVVGAGGTMTYVVSEECSAWSTEQRLTVRTVSRTGQAVEMVSDYTTLESRDGRSMKFRTTQTNNDETVLRVDGEAELKPDGAGEVHYDQPSKKTVPLPAGTLFPMMHTKALLEAAQKGETGFDAMLFDGTSPDGAQHVYANLSGWKLKDAGASFPELGKIPFSRVRLSFFSSDPAEMLPEFENSMKYYAGGESDDLEMNFGEFRLHGVLTEFRLLPPAKQCPE
ncbi:cell envelope integrity EipB family protein [Acetobacter sp. AN02]|uniref:EipB family protein n=1 Tax=Acetobacter sp. AN02 TaxID=2894186 RepID=UPI0024345049|nr:DUF1849 family protein [Acetobacter sp. AN02]MDG6095223.1 cell envelope integrity EipB family protein [Acetobacter sp. AN02]